MSDTNGTTPAPEDATVLAGDDPRPITIHKVAVGTSIAMCGYAIHPSNEASLVEAIVTAAERCPTCEVEFFAKHWQELLLGGAR